MDFWASERCQVWTLQASLHEKTLIYSAFSVFDLGYYWLSCPKNEKSTPITQFLIRILTAYRRYSVCRTDSFGCPSYSVLCGSRDCFGCELSDVAEVDVDLLRCGFLQG